MSEPYPYSPAPQPSYGQPYPPAAGFAAPAAKRPHPQSNTIFGLGLAGIVIPLCALIAWALGSQAKHDVEVGYPYVFEGKGKLGYTLGKVFGIIFIVCVVAEAVILGLGLAGVLPLGER